MATKKSAKKSSAKKSSAKKSSAKKVSAKKSAKRPSKAAGQLGAIKPTPGKCRDWKAVSNRMPPGPATLTVAGKCTFPTPGYKAKLVKAVPQGINPSILLLRKVVSPPTGPQPAVLQTINVTYKQSGGTQYKQVTILPEGVTVKVQIVV